MRPGGVKRLPGVYVNQAKTQEQFLAHLPRTETALTRHFEQAWLEKAPECLDLFVDEFAAKYKAWHRQLSAAHGALHVRAGKFVREEFGEKNAVVRILLHGPDKG